MKDEIVKNKKLIIIISASSISFILFAFFLHKGYAHLYRKPSNSIKTWRPKMIINQELRGENFYKALAEINQSYSSYSLEDALNKLGLLRLALTSEPEALLEHFKKLEKGCRIKWEKENRNSSITTEDNKYLEALNKVLNPLKKLHAAYERCKNLIDKIYCSNGNRKNITLIFLSSEKSRLHEINADEIILSFIKPKGSPKEGTIEKLDEICQVEITKLLLTYREAIKITDELLALEIRKKNPNYKINEQDKALETQAKPKSEEALSLQKEKSCKALTELIDTCKEIEKGYKLALKDTEIKIKESNPKLTEIYKRKKAHFKKQSENLKTYFNFYQARYKVTLIGLWQKDQVLVIRPYEALLQKYRSLKKEVEEYRIDTYSNGKIAFYTTGELLGATGRDWARYLATEPVSNLVGLEKPVENQRKALREEEKKLRKELRTEEEVEESDPLQASLKYLRQFAIEGKATEKLRQIEQEVRVEIQERFESYYKEKLNSLEEQLSETKNKKDREGIEEEIKKTKSYLYNKKDDVKQVQSELWFNFDECPADRGFYAELKNLIRKNEQDLTTVKAKLNEATLSEEEVKKKQEEIESLKSKQKIYMEVKVKAFNSITYWTLKIDSVEEYEFYKAKVAKNKKEVERLEKEIKQLNPDNQLEELEQLKERLNFKKGKLDRLKVRYCDRLKFVIWAEGLPSRIDVTEFNLSELKAELVNNENSPSSLLSEVKASNEQVKQEIVLQA